MGLLPFVLDASVIAKLALEEPGSAEFRAWSAEHAADDMRAPSLAYSEVGRLLQKAKVRGDAARLAKLHAQVMGDIQLHPPTAADGDGVWRVADGLSFYDAEYVRLAQRNGAVLVTADGKMAKAARRQGVQVKEF